MYQSHDVTSWVPTYSGIADPPVEPAGVELCAKRFLPSLGRATRSVEAQLQLAQHVWAGLGIFRRDLNVDVAGRSRVEVGTAHVVDHNSSAL